MWRAQRAGISRTHRADRKGHRGDAATPRHPMSARRRSRRWRRAEPGLHRCRAGLPVAAHHVVLPANTVHHFAGVPALLPAGARPGSPSACRLAGRRWVRAPRCRGDACQGHGAVDRCGPSEAAAVRRVSRPTPRIGCVAAHHGYGRSARVWRSADGGSALATRRCRETTVKTLRRAGYVRNSACRQRPRRFDKYGY
jgi:hypothetical protein